MAEKKEKKKNDEQCCNEEQCCCECGDETCCECEEKANKTDDYKNLLQIVQADFDNYRKRSLQLMNDAKQDGQINAIMRFLPALDSFDKAKPMIEDEKVLKGIEMIEKELYEALKSFGVEKIDQIGEKYNTKYHNVIMVKNDNSLDDDVITDISQAGYKMGDKIIRYAQVVINKKGE